MKDKKFLKAIILLSIPIALQNLITSVLNIFDQLMVSWLPPAITDDALSAVLLANQIVFIIQIIFFAVCNTANIFIAQHAQTGNRTQITSRAGLALLINLSFAVIMNVICASFPQAVIGIFNPKPQYAGLAADFLRAVSFSFVPMAFSLTYATLLRAVKKLKVALVANITAVASNIFLNYIFMFGKLGLPAYGLVGAAYGTILSRCIEALILLVGLLYSKSEMLASPKRMFKFKAAELKQYFKNFAPILCNEIFWVLSSTVYLYVYDKLPNSEIALAAVNIANSVDKILSVAMLGVGSAIGIVMSNVIVSKTDTEVLEYSRASALFSVVTGVFMALMTVACAFFAPSFFKNASEATQSAARTLLLLYSATAIFRTMNFTYVIGILRSGGDTAFCMIYETLCIWLISVPMVFIGGLVFKWNIYILYLLGMVSEVLKTIVFFFRARGKKWIKLRVDTVSVEQKSVPDIT